MTVADDWLRVTFIGGDDYECRMTILKVDDTTITVTRPWYHRWTFGWDWVTIIRQWLSEAPETLEPYDGLAEWLRDADEGRIGSWRCLSLLDNHRLHPSLGSRSDSSACCSSRVLRRSVKNEESKVRSEVLWSRL